LRGFDRAVLFDMDGVLLFSEEAWLLVYNDTLRHFGKPEIGREEYARIYGGDTRRDRDTYLPERTVEEVKGAFERFFAHHLDDVRANPEAPAVLAELRARGIGTAAATNTNRALAEDLLRRKGILPLLDALACADEAGAGKPDPAVLLLAAERLGVPLGRTLLVGDSRYDAGAAQAAGVPFVGYRFGEGPRIESLAEVLSLLPD
jgi:AHBA synthesis associated protein